MSTHFAVASVGLKQPLSIIRVPTVKPEQGEVRMRVQWTASTPFDLHQNDGGVLAGYPQRLGDGVAGTVVEIGPHVERLAVGDKVFGFTWREGREKAHQEFCTTGEYLLAKLPEGFTMQEAVTLPNNFVTVFHAMTADMGIAAPWPKHADYVPENGNKPILIWGGASSVGMYALQILRYYGYTSLIAVSSSKHHAYLQSLGAKWMFDYNDPHVVSQIQNTLSQTGNAASLKVLDCIGSKYGSIRPVSKIAEAGAKVAVLLPVIVKDSSETEDPVYELDANSAAPWAERVKVRGVRTHFYLENEFLKKKLQSEIMPTMLKEGIVKPNPVRVVEGDTLLERAQGALDILRRRVVSGERLVWRVSEE